MTITLSLDSKSLKKLDEMVKKSRNLKPVMREIEGTIMRPMKLRAWSGSGLRSMSGELQNSIRTFSGKKSAGVSVHTTPGKDLIIPKAITHTRGAKKREFVKYSRSKVRAYKRAGLKKKKKVEEHWRKNFGTPWGDIKPRPFIPKNPPPGSKEKIIKILKKHYDV